MLLGLGITAAVAAVLQPTLIAVLASTGLIRGPRDPGRATAFEAWIVHEWPALVLAELVVGALVAWRICRPCFASERRRVRSASDAQ